MRKRDRVGRERKTRDSEFQTLGAANKKERRSFADRISGNLASFCQQTLDCEQGYRELLDRIGRLVDG